MTLIARTMSPSGDRNLLDFGVTTSSGSDPVMWSAGDWFGVGAPDAWPQDAGMPFALADDSVTGVSGGAFAGDDLGIVDGTFPSSQTFFGSVDTVNGDNPDGTATAEWSFDISGATDLSVSLDMAAMGDFESSDVYTWSYAIDDGSFTDLFTSGVDESGSQTYRMQGGAEVVIDDPLQMNGVTLDDAFRTFTAAIDGTGSEMTIRVTGSSNGGDEAYAATNLVVSSGPILTLSLAEGSLAEGETTDVTVTRTGDLSAPLEVALSSSDATEATVDRTVTIAAGEASATATLTALEDGTVDPDASVSVTASAAGFDDASVPATIRNVDIDDVAIYDIQGAGHVSGFDGQTVRTGGIVTALASNGFYLQDATGDGDIATSDAIFVRSGETVAVGDALTVVGDVFEADPSGGGADLDITTLSATSVETDSTGNALPEAVLLGEGGRLAPTETFDDDDFTSFDPETDGVDFFESLEGMRVTAQDLTAVSPTSSFGEIFAVTDRGANATGLSERGTLNISPDDFNPERIQIDTAFATSGFENPLVNVGDTLGDVTGVLDYDFGNYQIVPTADFTDQVGTPGDDDGRPLPPGLAKLFGFDWDLPGNRPSLQKIADKVKVKLEHVLDKAGFDIDGPDAPVAPEVTKLEGDADTMTVASYNVLNLDPIVEDPANVLPGVTGAVDDDFGDGRFTAIAEQIAGNLNAPDIIGLQEIQDNTGAEGIDSVTDASETLELLISEIEEAGGPTYAYFDNPFILDDAGGGIPGGNIQTAYLYNPERVSYVEELAADHRRPGHRRGLRRGAPPARRRIRVQRRDGDRGEQPLLLQGRLRADHRPRTALRGTSGRPLRERFSRRTPGAVRGGAGVRLRHSSGRPGRQCRGRRRFQRIRVRLAARGPRGRRALQSRQDAARGRALQLPLPGQQPAARPHPRLGRFGRRRGVRRRPYQHRVRGNRGPRVGPRPGAGRARHGRERAHRPLVVARLPVLIR